MNGRRAGVLGLAGVVALGIGVFSALPHRSPTSLGATPPIVQGKDPSRPVQAPRKPAALLGGQAGYGAAAHAAPAVAAPLAPLAPVRVWQVGGTSPTARVIAPGAWLNAGALTISVRLTSPAGAAFLQPQVELRRVGRSFIGRPTVSGAPVVARGAAVSGAVHIDGLRDGVAYTWRLRVHDPRGPNSAWVGPRGVAVRIHLGHPSAPTLTLVPPKGPDSWIGTRRVAVRWSAPADASGISGYSYILSRSARARPPLQWRTARPGTVLRAPADGQWYVAVRALDNARTWGPAARLSVGIDGAPPRVRILSIPKSAVNPSRAHPLLRLGLTAWSRVTVSVADARGRVVRTILTSLHRPGYRLSINWDGRDSRGTLVPNGRYALRIAAVSRAGLSWGARRSLMVEGAPPAFVGYGLAQTGTYNLYNNTLDGPEAITATLDAPARLRIVATHDGHVMRIWELGAVKAGQVATANWDGLAAHDAPMPGGVYTFSATAVDDAGNRTQAALGWVVLDRRRIVVSLKQQRLWAMDGNHVLFTSLVTSGGPALPTPTGDFQIIDRESPFTMHSPYPTTSPFWYADSPTNFALLFQINGYFIHDAPWRSAYGPGSNTVDGIPGSNTTGTHGCVNVPYYPMAALFNWAAMYTPVHVRDDFTPHQA